MGRTDRDWLVVPLTDRRGHSELTVKVTNWSGVLDCLAPDANTSEWVIQLRGDFWPAQPPRQIEGN